MLIDKPIHVEPSKPLADDKPSGTGSHHPLRIGPPRVGRPMMPGIVGATLVVILECIPSVIQKWLRIREVGYTGVFWTLFSVRQKLFCAAFVVVSVPLDQSSPCERETAPFLGRAILQLSLPLPRNSTFNSGARNMFPGADPATPRR